MKLRGLAEVHKFSNFGPREDIYITSQRTMRPSEKFFVEGRLNSVVYHCSTIAGGPSEKDIKASPAIDRVNR